MCIRDSVSAVAARQLGAQGTGITGLGPPRGGARLAPLSCAACGGEHTFTASWQAAPGAAAAVPPQALVVLLPETAAARAIAVGADEMFLGKSYVLVAALTYNGDVYFAQGAKRGERVYERPLQWGAASPRGICVAADPFSSIAREGALLWYESGWKERQAYRLWVLNGKRFL